MLTKARGKMGRPVRNEGKNLKLTFLLDEDCSDTIDEEARRFKCSRSDALVDIIQHFKTCRTRQRTR